jgi:hypothetical protein
MKKVFMKRILFIIFLLSAIGIFTTCDKGIEPEPEKPVFNEKMGFEGKVEFIGNWPEGIKRTHLVVFKESIKTSADFFPPNLSFVVDSIPYRSRSFQYNSNENNFIPLFQLEPTTYKYIVIAQSKTPEISLDRKDWFIAGIYYNPGNNSEPGTLTLQEGKMLREVNIVVDFNSPPPQPPM